MRSSPRQPRGGGTRREKETVLLGAGRAEQTNENHNREPNKRKHGDRKLLDKNRISSGLVRNKTKVIVFAIKPIRDGGIVTPIRRHLFDIKCHIGEQDDKLQ